MALVRHLYRKEFSRQDIINLFRFIDWLMYLPEKEEHLFWQELSAFEEERKTPYITSVEKMGYKRGMEEGVQRGIEQGTRKGEALMLARLIARKFGMETDDVLPLIQPLNSDELTELSDIFLDFESRDAFSAWLRKRTEGKTRE